MKNHHLLLILPELMLTMLALLSQLSAVIFNNKKNLILNFTIVLAGLIVFATLFLGGEPAIGFNNSFVTNYTTTFCKALVLIFSISSIIIYKNYCRLKDKELKSEFATLILLSSVGIFITISSRNFLLLFCGMELSALTAYVLAGFDLKSSNSSEAALKYFILGALISCLTLFGISFVYGFGGSLDFNHILHVLNQQSSVNIGLVVGLMLFLSGIFFKLAAVPLHMWAPDVYEGAPIYSVAYFATASKIGIVAVLINIITYVIGDYKQISVDLIRIVAVLSMLVGAFGAIRQESLKRLMAYSTVLNIGYVLMGVALHNQQGNLAALQYILIYAVSVLGFFACLITILGAKVDEANFNDLIGLSVSHKFLAAAITIIMFSLIGLPPLAGFFGKYYLFYQAIIQKEFLLVFIAISTSVIAAYYYLKVIKTMYFLDVELKGQQAFLAVEPEYNKTAETTVSNGLLIINYLTLAFVILFSFFVFL